MVFSGIYDACHVIFGSKTPCHASIPAFQRDHVLRCKAQGHRIDHVLIQTILNQLIWHTSPPTTFRKLKKHAAQGGSPRAALSLSIGQYLLDFRFQVADSLGGLLETKRNDEGLRVECLGLVTKEARVARVTHQRDDLGLGRAWGLSRVHSRTSCTLRGDTCSQHVSA